MQPINIKTLEKYRCIQEGFVWENIPQLAVITGVNGAGKSQLLNILGHKDSINFICNFVDGTHTEIISSMPKNKLSMDGLIQYQKDRINRQVKIEDIDRQLKMYRENLKSHQNQQKNAGNEVQKQRAANRIQSEQKQINSLSRQKNDLHIFSYEEELSMIARILKKDVKDLSENDIRENANPFFNDLMEEKDFEDYVVQEYNELKETYTKLGLERKYEEMDKFSNKERSFQVINRLFSKYGFNNYIMLDPFPTDKSRHGEIRFRGRNNETINFSSLSSGEQMIVKFVIWSMGTDFRGNRINTMLLDEPDAHLHPSMCKMMIDIFSEISKSKEDGGSGIRVIITTHSPSTAAFTPKGSLFVMERKENGERQIIPATTESAVSILSDGIFTYESGMQKYSKIAESPKGNLLFVEGPTDVKHLTKAMSILGYDLDIDIIDLHDAGSLASFIQSTPNKLFAGKKLIALFDCDNAGKNHKFTGDVTKIPNVIILSAQQCQKKSFVLYIQAPEELKPYCPIEFLYPFDYLEKKGIIEKRNKYDTINLYKDIVDDPEELFKEYSDSRYLRQYKVKDNVKTSFAETIQKETDDALFAGFKPTLDIIREILEKG